MRKLSLLLLILGLLVANLPFTLAQEEEETFTLNLMHTNDTHSHHEPQSDGNGGVARLATVVNQIRGELENTLLLDAGDRFTGTLFHQQHRGADQIEVMNLLAYDAMALGNHEFDDGEDVLQAFLEGLTFPVLGANIDFTAFPAIDTVVEPYTILEVGGEQIGVIGLTTPDTPVSSSPSDEVLFDEDLIGITQQYVDELEAAGVNKIILLTHLGILVDTTAMPDLRGVDIIVGGHSHTLLSNAYSDADGAYPLQLTGVDGNPMLYVQAGEKNIYLGLLEATFDAAGVLTDWGGDVILLSQYITPDPAMQAVVDTLAEPIIALREQSIGAEASELLVGDRSVCRIEECALGNIITDAVRAETGVDIVITNGGGIRADIDAGDITVGDVLTVLPFGNLVATATLTGEQIVAALENGVSDILIDDPALIGRVGHGGRFPQVSGLRYSFDPTQEVGSRVSEVEVWNAETGAYEPIDLSASYYVATNDFMLNGGDGYVQFAEGTDLYAFGRPLDQVVMDYMTALGTVSPMLEGRITMIGSELAPRE